MPGVNMELARGLMTVLFSVTDHQRLMYLGAQTSHERNNGHINGFSSLRPIPRVLFIRFGEVDYLDLRIGKQMGRASGSIVIGGHMNTCLESSSRGWPWSKGDCSDDPFAIRNGFYWEPGAK